MKLVLSFHWWILGIELRQSDLAASAFTPGVISLACCSIILNYIYIPLRCVSLCVHMCVPQHVFGGWRAALCSFSSTISLALFWVLETGSHVTQTGL